MNLKSLVAGAVLALVGLHASATSFSGSGALNGTDLQVGPSFSASGAFTASMLFGDATGASAYLTDGTHNYQFLLDSSTSMFGHTFDTYSLGGTLVSGTYSLHVNGASGQYSGGVNYNVPANTLPVAAPVPEPETYAMMLLGLGALGVVGRRRKIK